MKVLVACEFSGVVIDAFAKLGHEAMSCDSLHQWTLPGRRKGGSTLWIGPYFGGSEATLTPDGAYVGVEKFTLCPDGSYVGGSGCQLMPEGSYVGEQSL